MNEENEMKLSEELRQLHDSGDAGKMVEGLAEKAEELERERDEARREACAWRAFARINSNADKLPDKNQRFPWESR